MVLRIVATLIVALLIDRAQAQTAPNIQWQKTYGGAHADFGYSINTTDDGGYIVTGTTGSDDGDVSGNHGADVWMIKLDSVGTLQWQKCLGGSGQEFEPYALQTSEGGYVMACTTLSNDGDVEGLHSDTWEDYWIAKLDALGEIQWQKCFGGFYDDHVGSVRQATDGGFVVCGITTSSDGDVLGYHGGTSAGDMWLLKLDSTGNLLWQKTLGGTSGDIGLSVQLTNDGGYIACGAASSADGDVSGVHGGLDAWVVKLDEAGAVQWTKALGGIGTEKAWDIAQCTDGGYIVLCESDSTDGDVTGTHGMIDYWVVKLDPSGELQWQRALGGTHNEYPYSMYQTANGGCVIAGTTLSDDGDVTGFHGSLDYWIVALDGSGNIEWQRTLGGSMGDWGRGMVRTSDGGSIVNGQAQSNNGDVSNNHGAFDLWVVKLDSLVTGLLELPSGAFTISPNPCHGPIRISTSYTLSNASLALHDATGRLVWQQRISGTDQRIDPGERAPGSYFLTLRSDQGIYSQHLLVE